MKKVLLGVFVLTLLVSGAAMAQGPGSLSQDRLLLMLIADGATAPAPATPATMPPKGEEPKHKKVELPADLGGYGGPMISYLWLDLTPTKPMTDKRGLDEFANGMFFYGGSGGVIKGNFFFGGFGFGGSQRVDDTVKGDSRSAEIDMGGGGLIIEANSGKGKAGVVAGAMLGAGGISLSAKGDDLGGDWNASSGVGLAYPYLGVWFAPTDWMFVQLDGGWMFFKLDATGGTYWSDNHKDMVDGQIMGGPQVNLKLNFGTMGKGK